MSEFMDMLAEMSALALPLIALVLGFLANAYVDLTYKKWSKVPSGLNATGADVARRMLDQNGANAVAITRTPGHLTDHYDPRDNRLHLSEENYAQGSVASVAVACHEAGHACQNAQGYAPMQIRHALVPVVNLTSRYWALIFMAGAVMELVGLMQIALWLFAFSVLFHLVTLPVEIDASRRAVRYLGTVSQIDQQGAKAVLRAAALTYVVTALMSILEFLRYAGLARRNKR